MNSHFQLSTSSFSSCVNYTSQVVSHLPAVFVSDKDLLEVLVDVLEDSIKSFGSGEGADFSDRKKHAEAAIQVCNLFRVKTEADSEQGGKGSVGLTVPNVNDVHHSNPVLLDYSALPLPAQIDDLYMNDEFDLNAEIARAKEQPFFKAFLTWMHQELDIEDDFEFGNADHGDPADHFNDYMTWLVRSGYGKHVTEDGFGFVFNTLSFSKCSNILRITSFIAVRTRSLRSMRKRSRNVVTWFRWDGNDVIYGGFVETNC